MTRVVILGGGPAGVGGAWRLRHLERAEVVLVEKNQHFGGNSGSFSYGEHRLDFGSHRLHPACEPAILADVRTFLGADLLDRPRHGRIRLLGKWVHFPLKPLDLLVHLDKSFALGTFGDMLAKRRRKQRPAGEESFATVLEASLGRTICEHFYFPYARKLWGHEPQALSAIQARRRVSAGSFAKLIRKVLGAVPGLKKPGAGRFFYPRQGFGQISEAYARRAEELGAELLLGTTVESVNRPTSERAPWRITVRGPASSVTSDALRVLEAEHVWSTLPITLLASLLAPAPPAEVLERARRIDYRSMLLIYLELDVPRFTEYDAHYFPGADVTITRLSEPKNYAVRSVPANGTVLCAELPCSRADAVWSLSDAELGALVARDLETAGLPLPRAPRAVVTRRLAQAYPIYQTGYEEAFEPLDRWISSVPRLLSYGRQGLFAHDNTHHALAMAYAAAECLDDGRFDTERWARHRTVFATHVVED